MATTMGKDQKFSVLMAVYHLEKPDRLDAAIASIWDFQNLKPDEVVVVKDGPLTIALDSVLENAKARIGHQLKIVSLEYNVGLALALNEGLKACSYEVIARMDSDDISEPTRFEKQIPRLGLGMDLCGGHIAEFDREMSLGKRTVPLDNESIRRYIRSRNPFNHVTVCYRKSVVQALGGYPNLPYREDYALWAKIVGAGHEVENIDSVLVRVRSGRAMVVRRNGWLYAKGELALQRHLIKCGVQQLPSALWFGLIRCIAFLMPTRALTQMYLYFLRSG